MVPSIDGRIVTSPWKLKSGFHAEYERTAKTFGADAWMIGRISMEPYAGGARAASPRRKRPTSPRASFIAGGDATAFAIALDPSGKLRWKSSTIDGEHVIAILTERVSDEHLDDLRAKGVSYLFGGRDTIDLETVLVNLRSVFGIEKLLLEGGGKINGSFLAANLIDELSVLVAPVADASVGTPSLFDAPGAERASRHLKLISVKRRPGDLVWLRYAVKR